MDQSTLNIAAGAVMACLGWFARMLWDRQEAQSRELSDFRVTIARDYATTSELNSNMNEIKSDLRYIRERLDETPQRRQSDARPAP